MVPRALFTAQYVAVLMVLEVMSGGVFGWAKTTNYAYFDAFAKLISFVTEALSTKCLLYPSYYTWALATTPILSILAKSLDEVTGAEWSECSEILQILMTSRDLAAWPKMRADFAFLVSRKCRAPLRVVWCLRFSAPV